MKLEEIISLTLCLQSTFITFALLWVSLVSDQSVSSRDSDSIVGMTFIACTYSHLYEHINIINPCPCVCEDNYYIPLLVIKVRPHFVDAHSLTRLKWVYIISTESIVNWNVDPPLPGFQIKSVWIKELWSNENNYCMCGVVDRHFAAVLINFCNWLCLFNTIFWTIICHNRKCWKPTSVA